MDIKSLEIYIENNNIDKAMHIIADIGAQKYKKAIPILIKYFQSTENNDIRNKIAIALSDIGSSEAVEPIIDMIGDPKTFGDRGTLLYALESLNYLSHINLLIGLLSDDDFEVSRHALVLIEKIAKSISEEDKQQYTAEIKNKIENFKDKIEFLNMAVDILNIK